MTKPRMSTHLRAQFCICILFIAGAAAICSAQAVSNFSGRWKQDNNRCQPKRSGDVTLKIERYESEVSVETTVSQGPRGQRHSVLRYTTDGKVSQSRGTDGDEFFTSAVWKDSSLFFSIEEHEGGRILESKETWSLVEKGARLQRTRERPDGTKQILLYVRQVELAHTGEQ